MIKHIDHGGKVLAILLRVDHKNEGIHFFTPNDFSQQLAYMCRPKDYIIPPHVHNAVPREILFTKEVLFIKSGKVRIDFYDDEQNYLESRLVFSGDIILLAYGGHGFQMLEDSEIIEVKQGPYAGEADKVRFTPIAADQVTIKD